MSNPLSRSAPSPFSRASRGKGDDTRAAGRPLRGVRWPELRPGLTMRAVRDTAKKGLI